MFPGYQADASLMPLNMETTFLQLITEPCKPRL